MNIEVCREPVYHLVIRDFFDDDLNKAILKEALSHKEHFEPAQVQKGLDDTLRNNLNCSYDRLYDKNRSKSILLCALQNKFTLDQEFIDLLVTSPTPFSGFTYLNTHETQVSRYGVGNYYNWHQDRIESAKRQISVVYYFNKEPKYWSGGELLLTSSPLHNNKFIEKNPAVKTITPENNMAVIFTSITNHMVEPTIAPEEFDKGRFSANMWVGFR